MKNRIFDIVWRPPFVVLLALCAVGLGNWTLSVQASDHDLRPAYVDEDGRENKAQLPEFFHLAEVGPQSRDVTCPNGGFARVPSDGRFLSEIPVVTADGERFASPWHFQQDYERRLEAGDIEVAVEEGVETVTLTDRDVHRPDASALCEFFGTEGTLEEVLGERTVQEIRSLPIGPPEHIRPRGHFNQSAARGEY